MLVVNTHFIAQKFRGGGGKILDMSCSHLGLVTHLRDEEVARLDREGEKGG